MQMRPNRVKDKLQNGERAYAVTGLYSPDEIDAFAPALLANGIDAVWFDGEHGPATPFRVGRYDSRLRPVGDDLHGQDRTRRPQHHLPNPRQRCPGRSRSPRPNAPAGPHAGRRRQVPADRLPRSLSRTPGLRRHGLLQGRRPALHVSRDDRRRPGRQETSTP